MGTILGDVKQYLGIDSEMTDFDPELLGHIEGSVSTLTQFGIGAVDLMVDAATTWENLIGETNLYVSAKTYIYSKVKIIFDPPDSSYALNALKERADELEWRLRSLAEGVIRT